MPTSAGPSPRYAWYGRVSTEDEQDPTLSFPRQLQNAERHVEEASGRVVAHYYDIESGTRAYAARGSGGLAGFDIPIPRDGGLQDLLADAARRPARFDRVIVESISRLSRNSSVAFRVEDELRQAGVRLCAADEPMEESFGTIVLRHVNIGIARGYHHELIVKSRQGQETSTRQGWHTGGVALYGYRFVTHDHPSSHKASRGINKRTLELDPVRAPVVRAIYDGYLGGGVGLTQIRDRLNAEPERAAPANERAAEIEAEIADLERRLTRQLVNLEADDVTTALRRRVSQRVAELEDAITERHERLLALARESATEAPTLADVAPLLDRLPILADSLDTAPQSELRALFDKLQLDVVYQPADGAVRVAVTLYDRSSDTGEVAAQVRAEDWSTSAPPAGLEPATRCLEGSRSIQLSYRGGQTPGKPRCFEVAAYFPGAGDPPALPGAPRADRGAGPGQRSTRVGVGDQRPAGRGCLSSSLRRRRQKSKR